MFSKFLIVTFVSSMTICDVMLINVLLSELFNALESELQGQIPMLQQSLLAEPSLLMIMILPWQKVKKQIQPITDKFIFESLNVNKTTVTTKFWLHVHTKA